MDDFPTRPARGGSSLDSWVALEKQRDAMAKNIRDELDRKMLKIEPHTAGTVTDSKPGSEERKVNPWS